MIELQWKPQVIARETDLDSRKQLDEDLAALGLPHGLNDLRHFFEGQGLEYGLQKNACFSAGIRTGIIRNEYHPILIQLLAPLLLAPFEPESVDLVRDPKGCTQRI